jgi:hypothetical protein
VAGKPKVPVTWESEALGVLAYEFSSSDRAEAEAKILGRLKRKKLGAYDARRIAVLRRLKDALQKEIAKAERSEFFTGPHGRYVEVIDFDVPRLTREMIRRHPRVPKAEIEWFVPFCVFVYHLL